MNTYYIITLNTSRGTKLFLDLMNTPTWSTDIEESCHFPTKEKAEQFANSWFKKCKSWTITERTINI